VGRQSVRMVLLFAASYLLIGLAFAAFSDWPRQMRRISCGDDWHGWSQPSGSRLTLSMNTFACAAGRA